MNTDLTTLTAFVPIAWRWTDRIDRVWHECEDAPLLLTDARRMFDQGLLLMANRHADGRVFVVVKQRTVRERWR